MDRQTPPSAWWLRTRRLRLTLVVCGVALAGLCVYCGARRAPEPPPTSLPRVAPLSLASAPHAAAPLPPLSLDDFRPLLATPELAPVASALELGNAGTASAELTAVLAANPPPAAARFRYDFLLARLLEQSGQFAAAQASYERAAAVPSPLAPYARLGSARAALGLGHATDALARLTPPLTQAVALRAAWPVIAEAAQASGDRARAIAGYRSWLRTLDAGSDHAEVALHFASLALEPSTSTERGAELLDALRLVRHVQVEALSQKRLVDSAKASEARLVAAIQDAHTAGLDRPSRDELLERARALLDGHDLDEAEHTLEELAKSLPEAEKWGQTGCDDEFVRGRVQAARRAYAQAGDTFEAVVEHCSDADLRARAQFAAGKAASSDGQSMLAAQRFALLESTAPRHSLADDARLYQALAYLDLGVEARFTELLNSIADDYPDGDMVVEGTFRLALRRFDKGDFQGAAHTLERVLSHPQSVSARAPDFAGRERYFHARALEALAEHERAKSEYQALIKDLPFSYYMLSAYTRLVAADPELARAALTQALESVPGEPVVITQRPEFSGPDFERALELFGVGDLDNGARELDALGLGDERARPELLWGLSLVYARAGAIKLSHAAARRALGASPEHWPAGDWLNAWQLAYPEPYREVVQREAKRTALEPSLIYAIMREESAFDPSAHSGADAYGLMQLILPTAKTAARPLGLPHDRAALERPSVNIALGSSVLAKYCRAFEGTPLLGIAAYNAGPGNPRRWLASRPTTDFDLWVELIPYVETRRYIKRVLSSRAAYAFLYQREAFESIATLPMRVQ
ncbi:MAG TPA: transglycosylase SLT domain-containing protein [Polyangiaceae bacterium]|jgi:soluble lytic murein transglycosylase